MERQIKFRGKLINSDEWLYGGYYQASTGEDRIITVDEMTGTITDWNVQPDTLGQFTGLLDKNGKEIYEGDRVNVLQAERNFDIVVKWSNEAMAFMACYADGKQSPFSWFTNLRIYQLTVIGNIHDNPELISDKQ